MSAHPTDDFDTSANHTAATLLAREELLKLNAYDDVVELLQRAYSACFDATAKLADTVSKESHDEVVKDAVKEAEEEAENRIEALQSDLKSAQEDLDRAHGELVEERREKTALEAKLVAAREMLDDVEAVLERWRARDGSPRSGDPPARKKRTP